MFIFELDKDFENLATSIYSDYLETHKEGTLKVLVNNNEYIVHYELNKETNTYDLFCSEGDTVVSKPVLRLNIGEKLLYTGNPSEIPYTPKDFTITIMEGYSISNEEISEILKKIEEVGIFNLISNNK